ncbi:putative heme/steroid binding protein [Hydrogenoanaerobacterium saccharovorans]|uniref:Predicted heme/steroid binding protein n=1 Tax=Hydrogenoanaerobacterium saccharovorans TaxID=474960 RepID=A0A1H8APU5_9FIRM|nr:cytochrome b5 domain-containing protein [Hydrogenoanaerobacterium saccharovorans]RPF47859.1 putative heme/steroid binding protein [Hydrogenoanaerobacterium saccharovorans]SEM71848.1 Predicted heme/steroid binding protein [Hydrogenoanaerobacterium saccharovorans]
MMNSKIMINLINNNLNEINNIIDCLYTTTNSCVKNKLLNQLRKNISNLCMLVQGLQNSENTNSPQIDTIRTFTEAELSKYNGRNGNPAYVAVNGIVYDVTNNAAWGGATHFGLVAGTDVTSQFASCHAGQPILSKLKVVGKMVE